MTPQELKASILQLAIQGKLVEQRPEEGTGEELYRQIQSEKQRLIKSGKIKKDKPLPEITPDEIPFDIPVGWKWIRLGQVFTTIMGQSPDGKSVVEGQSGVEFHQGKIYFSEVIIAKSPQSTIAPSKIAPANSLLLCVRAPVGKVNITDRDLCIGRGLSALVCHGGVSVTFAFYWIQSLENEFVKKSTGTTFKAISADVINSQLIPLPPLAEQKRIVAKIEELLPYIDRYEKAWSKLEDFNKRFPGDMQKSLLQMAIQGKLVDQRPEEGTAAELLEKILAARGEGNGKRGTGNGKNSRAETPRRRGKSEVASPREEIPDDEKPFDIPESWEWVRLGEIAEVQLGKMLDKGKNKGTPYPYLANLSVRWRSFDLSALRMMPFTESECEKFALLPGDVLMCEGGVPGRCAVWREKNSPVKYQKAIHRIRSKILFPDFIQRYFEAICDSSWFVEMFTGTTIKHLPRETLCNTLIPLPPLAEQKRIVAKLAELLPLCERLKGKGLA